MDHRQVVATRGESWSIVGGCRSTTQPLASLLKRIGRRRGARKHGPEEQTRARFAVSWCPQWPLKLDWSPRKPRDAFQTTPHASAEEETRKGSPARNFTMDGGDGNERLTCRSSNAQGRGVERVSISSKGVKAVSSSRRQSGGCG
ncbi:hypothetical protein FH972_022645 [Carpinus fangiana]|uniref:Uncharacterized protein n=1 Tax=Carpinus fangiana TaxID=176857 RepID=A0A5N6KTE3_9ROSI|nr:hypothetical protein FH972_022645 [Carpinus fangiana]